MFLQHSSADATAAGSSSSHVADAPPRTSDSVNPAAALSGTALPHSTTPGAGLNGCDATASGCLYTKVSGSMQHPAAQSGGAAGSAASSPVQQDVLSQQGLNGSVAAAAALHYKQQQAKLAGSASSGHAGISVAALHGLQDQRLTDLPGVSSSTAPAGGASAVFTYASPPKGKATTINGTVVRQPVALPGVSSLYGRLRSSTLGGGIAAASGTGAAAAAAAAAGVSIGSQAATGLGISGNRCQVVSQPQLWAPVGDIAVNSAGGTTADSSADYLSLLMAAVKFSAADTGTNGGQTVSADQRLCLLQPQLQQQQGSQLNVPNQGAAAHLGLGPNTSTACTTGLPPTPLGLMSPQLPAQQQQQMLLAGLSGSAASALSQEQLMLLQSNGGGLLYNNTAGMSGLQQYANPELMYKSAASTLPGLTLNGGTTGLAAPMAAIKVDHAASAAGGTHKPEGTHNPLYKTELCRTWSETGSCRYGARCQFAHGQVELRAVVRPPKYKTQPCRTYSLTGKCPYGARCNFIHDGEDDESVISRSRTEAAAAAGINSTALSLARASSNGPTSVSSATGAFYAASNVLGGDAGAAGPHLFSSLANGKIDAARLGSLPNGWNSLLAVDDSNNGSISSLGLGPGTGLPGSGAVNNLYLGLGGLGVGATDGASGAGYATSNGVVGLNQMPNGMVAGSGSSVAPLGQYGLLSNMANAQLGLSGIGSACGLMGDNFSQML